MKITNTFKFIIAAMAVLALSACSGKTGPVMLDPIKAMQCVNESLGQTETNVPSAEVVERVIVPAPTVPEDTFAVMAAPQRERVLTDYTVQLLNAVSAANLKLDTIKLWRTKALGANNPTFRIAKPEDNGTTELLDVVK